MANMTTGQILRTLAEHTNWQGDSGLRDWVLDSADALDPPPVEPLVAAGESGSSPEAAAATDPLPIESAAKAATAAKV